MAPSVIADDIDMAKKRAQEAGATIFTPTKEEMALWDKAMEPLWSAWVDSMKAKGINNGEEMLNYWQEPQSSIQVSLSTASCRWWDSGINPESHLPY